MTGEWQKLIGSICELLVTFFVIYKSLWERTEVVGNNGKLLEIKGYTE